MPYEDLGILPPIITLGDTILVPLQMDLTDLGIQKMQEEILELITRREVTKLIIDVRALDVIDSFLARMLVTTLKRASLMGVKGYLSGIKPHVAITLVYMGLQRLRLYDVEVIPRIDDVIDLAKERKG